MLKACSNVFAPGPDHITWCHLKLILVNNTCTVGILSLANTCLSLGHWPRYFKEPVSVIMSYASPPVWKLHPHSEVISKTYKPAFHGSHLSRNTSYGSTATLWVFRLPWRRYFYSTRSSMTELLLSVSQH